MSNRISRPDLLKVVYETFVGRTHLFDVFSDVKWKDTGIEHWVQTELIVALADRGYNVTTKGKVKKDCDLLVNGTALEIRTVTAPVLGWVLDAIEGHSRADMYFFLARVDQVFKEKLNQYLEGRKFESSEKGLSNDWLVMIVEHTPHSRAILTGSNLLLMQFCADNFNLRLVSGEGSDYDANDLSNKKIRIMSRYWKKRGNSFKIPDIDAFDFLMIIIFDRISLDVLSVHNIPVTFLKGLGLDKLNRFKWTMKHQKAVEEFTKYTYVFP